VLCSRSTLHKDTHQRPTAGEKRLAGWPSEHPTLRCLRGGQLEDINFLLPSLSRGLL